MNNQLLPCYFILLHGFRFCFLPLGFMSEHVGVSIGNYVGEFVAFDSSNFNFY